MAYGRGAEAVYGLVYGSSVGSVAVSERREHGSDVLPLVALVRRVVDASGLTLRAFAESRGVKYGTLQRYYNRKLPPLRQGLKPDTIDDLTLALDVPRSVVEQAADRSVNRLYRVEVPGELGEQLAAMATEAGLGDGEAESFAAEMRRLLDAELRKRANGGG